MKDKLAGWAREQGVPTRDNFTVEQICDAIIDAGKPWPPVLTNEEGWQFWTAKMRHGCSIQSIQWDEIMSDRDEGRARTIEITFRLQDKREHKRRFPKTVLDERDFGAICRDLEDEMEAWKATDDAEREERMRREDEEYQTRAPDLMEYVIGFRAWTLAGHRLKPIGMGGDVWDGGKEIRASCGNGHEHRSPSDDCECGLYAWHRFSMLKRDAADGSTKVIGAVRAHGRIAVHKEGFRAEYMQPVLLGYDDSHDVWGVDKAGEPSVARGPDFARVSEIAAQLGDIQVVPYRILEDAAGEFGQRIPMDNPDLMPE